MTFQKLPKMTPEEFDNGGASKPEKPPALDPKARPKRAVNVRLNDYELHHLARLAGDEDTSMQRLIRRCIRNFIKHHSGTRKAS